MAFPLKTSQILLIVLNYKLLKQYKQTYYFLFQAFDSLEPVGCFHPQVFQVYH